MTFQFSLCGSGRQLDSSTESDVDYWRKRAGWMDDDASMSDYNQGVYNTMYGVSGDDDDGATSSSSRGGATPDIQISNLFYFIHY